MSSSQRLLGSIAVPRKLQPRAPLSQSRATAGGGMNGTGLSSMSDVRSSNGSNTPRAPPPKLESVLALMHDPATADQHERQSEQLLAALEPYSNGFTPAVAIDHVPSIMGFLVEELKQAEEKDLSTLSLTSLTTALSAMLQYIAFPIRCTTLDDQRKHDAGLRSLLDASCLALELPQATMRIATLIVQRQIFGFIRQQCNDDMTPSNVTFHKKKEFQRSISETVVCSLLATWSRAMDNEAADGGTMMGATANSTSVGGVGGADDVSDSDDDQAAATAGSAGAVAASTKSNPMQHTQGGEQRNCGPELVAVVKAVQELSYYKSLCSQLLENGIAPLLFDTMDRCAAGERCLTLTVEVMWNVLSLDHNAAEVMGSQENMDIIETCFSHTLALGYMLKDRELRNDIIIVCKLLATFEPNIVYFGQILPLLLDLSCGAEKYGYQALLENSAGGGGRGDNGSNASTSPNRKPDPLRVNPLVDPTYHYTIRVEELQLKKLCWDLLDQLCCNSDFAKLILDWGFINAIVSYIDVRCEVPAVVRWSTLQLLDLQAQSLRTLSSIAVIGADYFSAAGGADIVHEYIAECPDVQLRNLGVSVLAQTATTHRRRELVEAGSIPLALALLRDTGDNALRVECLNLLADVVDRSEDLQEVFLECDGVRTVLPLMTLNPDYYTELLDTVTFASVDCIWSCAFGRDENEHAFLQQGGLNALLTVVETCAPWMLSFPLSCLADFLQSPDAVKTFRSWVSSKTGKTATQILISFWKMHLAILPNPAAGLNQLPANTNTSAPAAAKRSVIAGGELTSDDDATLGDASRTNTAGVPSTRNTTAQQQPQSFGGSTTKSGNKVSGLSTIGTSKVAHLKPTVDSEDNNQHHDEQEQHETNNGAPTIETPAITIDRIGLEQVPRDIKFLVEENSIQFKIHVAMSLVGFDDHKELDDMERGTLIAIERFVDLCKDEIWASVESSLAENGIRPTTPDAEKLRLLRIAAESRSTQLLQAHDKHKTRHEVRQAEGEATFYKSLIKKTEEKHAGGPRKAVGLSITEAKIRKAQMLKQSFKHALSKQAGGGGGSRPGSQAEGDISGGGSHEDDHHAEISRQQRELEEQERELDEASGMEPAQRLERCDPGQRAMTDAEYGILQALNNIRTNPLSLIPLLEEKLKFLNEAGNAFHVPNRDPETCVEGASVYLETIDFIKTVRPLVTLFDVPIGLLFAARDHGADLSRRMEVSQNGVDGSTPLTRMQRYGKLGTNKYAQLIGLAASDPVELLMNLVVNDGVKSRIDRKTIFDPDMRLAGISTGPHSIHETVSVILLGQEYVELSAPEQRRIHAQVTQAAKQRAHQG